MAHSKNDNPMPAAVYEEMTNYLIGFGVTLWPEFDLHHALVDKGDVRGMPLKERKKIHDKRNLWWVSKKNHASHADIEDKRVYYRALCQRFGKQAVDDFVRSFNWKSTPPVTVEWLESEE